MLQGALDPSTPHDFALDVAASELYDKSKEVYGVDGKEISSADMVPSFSDCLLTREKATSLPALSFRISPVAGSGMMTGMRTSWKTSSPTRLSKAADTASIISH